MGGEFMDERDRESLLVRIDERTTFLAKDIKDFDLLLNQKLDVIREQQETQNGAIEAALILATSNQTSIKWIRLFAGGISTAMLAFTGFFIKHLTG